MRKTDQNKILITLSPLSKRFSRATYHTYRKSECCWKTKATESIFIIQHKCSHVKCAIKQAPLRTMWATSLNDAVRVNVIAVVYQQEVKTCSPTQRLSKLKTLAMFLILKYLRHCARIQHYNEHSFSHYLFILHELKK